MYSQHNEEKHILSSLSGIEKGTFLDIGAWHPTIFSNVRALYEQGWSGILVEPSPGPLLNLLRACQQCGAVGVHPCSSAGNTYATDPRLKIISAAVGTTKGIMQMHVSDDGLTTGDEASFKKWEGHGSFFGSIWVPVITIIDIFRQFGNFDFINIDTEGISVHIFMMLLRETLSRPQCICVEHDGQTTEIMVEAQNAGYRAVYIDGTNIVLSL